MESNSACGICGGGQCLPDSHYFPPNNPGSGSSSPDGRVLENLRTHHVIDEFDTEEFAHFKTRPFVPGVRTTPQLDLAVRQGGLDQAAAAAKARESPAPAQPSAAQLQVDQLIAAEKERLAREHQEATEARQLEFDRLQNAKLNLAKMLKSLNLNFSMHI